MLMANALGGSKDPPYYSHYLTNGAIFEKEKKVLNIK